MELKDWGLSQLGMDIWAKKYQNNGESFEEWLDRVSNGDKDVKQLIVDKKFLFGGRILASRGVTDRKVTYSNCYVLPEVEDSIEGIYETCRDLAKTFSRGGEAMTCRRKTKSERELVADINKTFTKYCGSQNSCDTCKYQNYNECVIEYLKDLLKNKGEE